VKWLEQRTGRILEARRRRRGGTGQEAVKWIIRRVKQRGAALIPSSWRRKDSTKRSDRKRGREKTRHQIAGVENAGLEVNDVARIRNGQNIGRPKNTSKPIKSCLSRFEYQWCLHRLQFLSAVSHSMGAHAGALRQTNASSSSSHRCKNVEITIKNVKNVKNVTRINKSRAIAGRTARCRCKFR